MAFGDGILTSFDSGFALGNLMREKKRKDAIRNAFAKAYNPGGVESVPFVAPEEAEFGLPSIPGLSTEKVTPPSVDYKNAIAELVKGGHGEEAFNLENKLQQNELARLLTATKLHEATRRKAPTTRQVPINTQGDLRTEEFDDTTGAWREVAVGRKSPLVQVDTGTKEADKEFIKETRENFSRLRDAPTALKNIEEAKLLIPKAGVFMGTGGGTLLESAKFLNNRLGLQIQTEGVKSAEELRSRVFFQILENLKKMDASPSQRQQEIMMQALGNLGTDPNALASILDAFGDAVRDKVTTHNTIVTDAEKRGTKFPHRVTIDIPAKASAAGAPSQKQYKLGDIVDGPDGKKYRIVGLSKDGDHDIAPIQ